MAPDQASIFIVLLVLFGLFAPNSAHPAESAKGLEEADKEIGRLAAKYDGSASPESQAAASRVREILSQAAAAGVAGGKGSESAWGVIERTLKLKERSIAVEAALVLIGLGSDEALSRLFRSFGSMDLAVRRHSANVLLATGKAIRGSAAIGAMKALAEEPDTETAAALVRLVASIGGLEAARIIHSRSPPPPQAAPSQVETAGPLREVPRDGSAVLRDTVVAALAAQDDRETVEWLAGPVFAESLRDWAESKEARADTGPQEEAHPRPPAAPKQARGKLWVAARVAAERCDPRARAAVEGLLSFQDAAVSEAAFEAVSKLGFGPSRGRLEALLDSEETAPGMSRRAAVAIGSIDREAGLKALLDMSARAGWEHRAEAVAGLTAFEDDESAFRRCLRLLGDPNREVRSAAYGALRHFRRKEAITAVIDLLAPLRSQGAELAQSYLEWASGKQLGRDPAAWRGWWATVRDEFQFPAKSRPDPR